MARVPSTHIVTDLGFGDAGKGTMVDALARRCSSPPLVVRHNGGAQAGHNVVTPDGRHHTFSQFGAATFVPGARTLLSRHMVMHPQALMVENEHLEQLGVGDALARLVIDERAVVITPYHQAANRLREIARGDSAHGTCGIGVGEAVSDSLTSEVCVYAFDLYDPYTLAWKLKAIRERKHEEMRALGAVFDKNNTDAYLLGLGAYGSRDVSDIITDMFVGISKRLQIVSGGYVNTQVRESEHVIFEGAQGVLLDEWYGFHPHTTWSTTTCENAMAMVANANREGPVTRLGVVRSYATRHGAGPFPTESAVLTQQMRDPHNTDTGPQGQFRVGHFDVPLTKYALSVCPVDALVMTHCDRAPGSYVDEYDVPVDLRAKRCDLDHQERLGKQLFAAKATHFTQLHDPVEFPRIMAEKLEMPIAALSYGPSASHKVWKR